jgi:glycerate dehydrogenase
MKIVFLDAATLGDVSFKPFERLGEFVKFDSSTPEEARERVKDADVLLINKVLVNKELIDAAPNLRLICIAATGVNNIDVAYAASKGIPVRNAVGYSTHTVAEATLGAILTLQRQVLYYDRYVKDGRYSASGRFVNFDRPTHRLWGKKWGIIGLGNIGRKVADLATAFGCEVAYYSTSGVARDEKYERKELNELLSWADIITVHCPLNAQTNNLIDKEQVALIKPNALIVNVARGGIVNEQAIADALNEERIAGAAFDVYPTEPMPLTSPLLSVKNPDTLLLSPHNGWSAVESIEDLVECVATNIKNYITKD